MKSQPNGNNVKSHSQPEDYSIRRRTPDIEGLFNWQPSSTRQCHGFILLNFIKIFPSIRNQIQQLRGGRKVGKTTSTKKRKKERKIRFLAVDHAPPPEFPFLDFRRHDGESRPKIRSSGIFMSVTIKLI